MNEKMSNSKLCLVCGFIINHRDKSCYNCLSTFCSERLTFREYMDFASIAVGAPRMAYYELNSRKVSPCNRPRYKHICGKCLIKNSCERRLVKT